MKRLVVVVIAACVSMTASAQDAKKKTGMIGHAIDKSGQTAAYGMSGCGLGSVLFGESENRGGQILASTTNGIYGNNTFGMSSGTSNCVPDHAATAEIRKNMDMFVAANRESLANDIAKSNGETIVAISNIMGCKDSTYLGAKLQSRYEAIFATKEETKISDNMWSTVTTDRYLVENCKL